MTLFKNIIFICLIIDLHLLQYDATGSSESKENTNKNKEKATSEEEKAIEIADKKTEEIRTSQLNIIPEIYTKQSNLNLSAEKLPILSNIISEEIKSDKRLLKEQEVKTENDKSDSVFSPYEYSYSFSDSNIKPIEQSFIWEYNNNNSNSNSDNSNGDNINEEYNDEYNDDYNDDNEDESNDNIEYNTDNYEDENLLYEDISDDKVEQDLFWIGDDNDDQSMSTSSLLTDELNIKIKKLNLNSEIEESKNELENIENIKEITSKLQENILNQEVIEKEQPEIATQIEKLDKTIKADILQNLIETKEKESLISNYRKLQYQELEDATLRLRLFNIFDKAYNLCIQKETDLINSMNLGIEEKEHVMYSIFFNTIIQENKNLNDLFAIMHAKYMAIKYVGDYIVCAFYYNYVQEFQKVSYCKTLAYYFAMFAKQSTEEILSKISTILDNNFLTKFQKIKKAYNIYETNMIVMKLPFLEPDKMKIIIEIIQTKILALQNLRTENDSATDNLQIFKNEEYYFILKNMIFDDLQPYINKISQFKLISGERPIEFPTYEYEVNLKIYEKSKNIITRLKNIDPMILRANIITNKEEKIIRSNLIEIMRQIELQKRILRNIANKYTTEALLACNRDRSLTLVTYEPEFIFPSTYYSVLQQEMQNFIVREQAKDTERLIKNSTKQEASDIQQRSEEDERKNHENKKDRNKEESQQVESIMEQESSISKLELNQKGKDVQRYKETIEESTEEHTDKTAEKNSENKQSEMTDKIFEKEYNEALEGSIKEHYDTTEKENLEKHINEITGGST